jgi:hypothetical protein
LTVTSGPLEAVEEGGALTERRSVDEDDRHFWLVRNRDGGIEVPVLQEDVAETFREAGWKVTRLPLAALEDVDLQWLRAGGARRGRGKVGGGRTAKSTTRR